MGVGLRRGDGTGRDWSPGGLPRRDPGWPGVDFEFSEGQNTSLAAIIVGISGSRFRVVLLSLPFQQEVCP
jgi:hypothetical protein